MAKYLSYIITSGFGFGSGLVWLGLVMVLGPGFGFVFAFGKPPGFCFFRGLYALVLYFLFLCS